MLTRYPTTGLVPIVAQGGALTVLMVSLGGQRVVIEDKTLSSK